MLEQFLLSLVGGSLGIWVAWMALAAFVRTAPVDLPRVHEVALDGRVLAFPAAVSILTSLLVAVFPAFEPPAATFRRRCRPRRRLQAIAAASGATRCCCVSGRRVGHPARRNWA